MTDCKARQCWCKEITPSEKDQIREALRIMQDRIIQLEALPKFQLSYHNSVFKRIEDLEKSIYPNHSKLEQTLAHKNEKIKKLTENIQKLEKHLGDLNRRHEKTLNELKCAILNDRESRSKLTALQKKSNKSISFKCPACDVVGVEFT